MLNRNEYFGEMTDTIREQILAIRDTGLQDDGKGGVRA